MEPSPFKLGPPTGSCSSYEPGCQNAELMRLHHELNLDTARTHLQERLVIFICSCVRMGLVGALTIFILQGFGKRSGFHLADPFMHWIGSATLGCVSTLAVLVYKCFFAQTQSWKGASRTRKRSV